MPAHLSTVLSRSGWKPYRQRAVLRPVSEQRALYLSPTVQIRLDPKKTNLTMKQLAGVAAKLNRFVQGAPVTVATPDNGGNKGDVKALKNRQGKVFQMRFFEVAPQVRLLGVFPQFDVFLGCRIFLREELEGRWSEEVNGMFRQLEAMGRDMPECLDYSNLDAVLSNWKVSI